MISRSLAARSPFSIRCARSISSAAVSRGYLAAWLKKSCRLSVVSTERSWVSLRRRARVGAVSAACSPRFRWLSVRWSRQRLGCVPCGLRPSSHACLPSAGDAQSVISVGCFTKYSEHLFSPQGQFLALSARSQRSPMRVGSVRRGGGGAEGTGHHTGCAGLLQADFEFSAESLETRGFHPPVPGTVPGTGRQASLIRLPKKSIMYGSGFEGSSVGLAEARPRSSTALRAVRPRMSAIAAPGQP